MERTKRRILALIEQHRTEAHAAVSVEVKIRHIDAMRDLRRLRAGLHRGEREELANIVAALAAASKPITALPLAAAC